MNARPVSYRVPQLSLRIVRERRIAIARSSVTCNVDAAAIASAMIGDRPVEHLVAILLDGRNGVTGVTVLAQGGMHSASVRMADILRPVLVAHASAFVLAHNHPSGDPTPSPEDVSLTEKVRAAANLVGVPLLDHVVVARDGFASVGGDS